MQQATTDSLKNIALVVHACDRYELLFRGFSHYFQQNWAHETGLKCYFFTEEKSIDLPGFINLKTGRGEWSNRLKKALELIEEPYVLYFQEDMWLNKKVSPAGIGALLSWALQHNIGQLKLNSSEVYVTKTIKETVSGFHIAQLDNERSGFLMSHQVTLWDKNVLIQQLLPGEHPWRNERLGSERLRRSNALIYQCDFFAENGKPCINTNPDPALRSEYHTVSVNATLSEEVLFYIDNMLVSDNAELVTYAKRLEHHYMQRITHDGREQPRRDGIFKKIKRLFTGK